MKGGSTSQMTGQHSMHHNIGSHVCVISWISGNVTKWIKQHRCIAIFPSLLAMQCQSICSTHWQTTLEVTTQSTHVRHTLTHTAHQCYPCMHFSQWRLDALHADKQNTFFGRMNPHEISTMKQKHQRPTTGHDGHDRK